MLSSSKESFIRVGKILHRGDTKSGSGEILEVQIDTSGNEIQNSKRNHVIKSQTDSLPEFRILKNSDKDRGTAFSDYEGNPRDPKPEVTNIVQ